MWAPPTTYGGALMIECPSLSPDMGGPFSFQKWDTPFLSPDVLLFLPVTQFGPYPPLNPLPTPNPPGMPNPETSLGVGGWAQPVPFPHQIEQSGLCEHVGSQLGGKGWGPAGLCRDLGRWPCEQER